MKKTPADPNGINQLLTQENITLETLVERVATKVETALGTKLEAILNHHMQRSEQSHTTNNQQKPQQTVNNDNHNTKTSIDMEKIIDTVQETATRRITNNILEINKAHICLLYTSPSPRDQRGSRMPSSA